MKINKLIYALSAVAVAMLSSCSDFLDTPTDTRVELKTTEQLRMLMNSAYPPYNYIWPCELMSDNMEDNNAPDDNNMRYNLAPYNRGDDEMFRFEPCESASDTETPSAIWEGFYNSVASANAVLDKLNEFEAKNGSLDDTQLAIKGEALLLRSFNHFCLAQVFCEAYAGPELSKNKLGIPYMTKSETTVKPHYERGTLAQTYENIVADLEAGLPLIDNSLYTVPKYHFNTAAAYAYAARLYLFMRQYKRAFNYANMAFGAQKVDNVDSFDPASAVDATLYLSDIYNKLGTFYYLSDFGLYQNGIDKQSNFLLIATNSVATRHFSGAHRYSVIRNALNSTLHGASPSWSRFKWVTSNGKGSSFTMHPCFNGCSFTNGSTEYGLFNGCNIQEHFEYTDKVAGIGYPHITRREFFGEETLFVRAEARLFLGDTQGALADLDLWEKNRRKTPGADGNESQFVDLTVENINTFYVDRVPEDPESTNGGDSGYGIAKPINIEQVCPETDATVSAASVMGMLQCIQHFRRIETIHMGFRWFDIKRYGIEFTRYIGKDAEVIRLTLDDPRRAIQIPSEVVAAGFQANPRWEVKKSDNIEYVVPSKRPEISNKAI
ncbi:MAG: RagB/SusD family nutrient uptake outer membrane protein [Muribaculaceae bacterium]|nr:RagB/SusD family nutrient uptake outer membrane protein [Muribaculaceae bacterium]